MTNDGMPLRRSWIGPVPPLVLAVAGGVVLLLLLVAGQYGFHRDELYFIVAGRHPAWGYVDQPPFTPLLSAATVALLGLSPLAIRIVPALVISAIVVITALIARDLGGSRRAQLLAAVTVGLSGYLAAGHLDHTTTFDLLAWALIAWLMTRLLARGDPRLWLAVGLVTGLALENKDTVIFLVAGLLAGMALSRRWALLGSRWPWLAGLAALLLWLPNLVWQAQHDVPQLAMASALAAGAADNRARLLPELLLLAGPVLFPVSVAGLWWLLRRRESRAWRPLGWAFLAIVTLVVASGGKSYYAVGFDPVLMAAGAIVVDAWLARGHRRLRRAGLLAAGAASGLISAVLVLPLVPAASLASTPIPGIYRESAEQVGWPELVATVRGVVAGLTPSERSGAVILTSNYGEAAALELLGPGLPPVYSGHNSYWTWGPPGPDRSIVILVGRGLPSASFEACRAASAVDNGLGLANQEQGAPVLVCGGPRQPWSVLWPSLRHDD